MKVELVRQIFQANELDVVIALLAESSKKDKAAISKKLIKLLSYKYIEDCLSTDCSLESNIKTPSGWTEFIIDQFGLGSRKITRSQKRSDMFKSPSSFLAEELEYLFSEIYPMPREARDVVLSTFKANSESVVTGIINHK